MLCERSDKIFNDYLDGDLAPGKMSQLELHLAECGACRREFESLKLADDYLRRGVRQLVEEIPVPDGLLAGFEKRLAGEKRGLLLLCRVSPLARYTGFAATFLILVVAASMFRANLGPLGRLAGQPDARSSLPLTEMAGEAPVSGEAPAGAAAREEQIDTGSQESGQNDSRLLNKSGDRNTSGEGKTEAGENLRNPFAMPPAPATPAHADRVEGSPFPAATQAPGEINGRQEGSLKSTPKVAATPGYAPPGQGTGGAVAPWLMAGAPVNELGIPVRESMDQAVREAGFTPLLPSYMPAGTSLAGVAWQKDAIYLQYRVGQQDVTIGQRRVPESESGTAGGSGSKEGGTESRPVDISGVKGYLTESPGGSVSTSHVAVSWQREGWSYNVEGELPSYEILKIANSLEVKGE